MSGFEFLKDPALMLAVSLIVAVGSIVWLRIGAFLALLASALTVAFWSAAATGSGGGDLAAVFGSVGTSFGETAGKIGILIVFGTIIGQCMTDAGSADRIVRSTRRVFGEKRMPAALAGSAFLLSIPVFYDATFYLLLPLAKSTYRAVRKNYLFYLLAVGLAATISHTTIPPTPGPIAVAETLGVPLSTALGIGLAVGVVLLPISLGFAWLGNRILPNPRIDPSAFAADPNAVSDADADGSRGDERSETALDAVAERANPPLWLALLPIALPVVLIAVGSIVKAARLDPAFGAGVPESVWSGIALLGDSTVALGLSALVAMGTFVFWSGERRPKTELEKRLNVAISSAGTIVLITAAGGAYGAALRAAGIGDRIQELFATSGGLTGTKTLVLAFLSTALLKSAQGSSTTAMITSASIFAATAPTSASLGFNLGYLGAAICVGSSVASWMNDSGFCVFSRSSGVSEFDSLKTWTLGTGLLGCAGFGVVFALSRLFPAI